MSESGKDYNQQQQHRSQDDQQHHYGTFQGVHNYPPPPPVIGFPQPGPPTGAATGNPYVHAYQPVTGYAVAEGRPVRQRRLSCCGIGIGWFLFITGFFLAAIPWYVGAFMLMCARYDHREKPGYIACLVAAIIGTIVVLYGVASDDWDWDWDW